MELYFNMEGCYAVQSWLVIKTARFHKSLSILAGIVSMSTNWIENERFGLVLVKMSVFKIRTPSLNPSTGFTRI